MSGDLLTIEYTLFKSIVALSSDHVVTRIPEGAIVEGPRKLRLTGIVNVTYNGQVMRVFALDLQDGGRIDAGGND